MKIKMITLFICLLNAIVLKGVDNKMAVSKLDLERYLGKWYEIARSPNPFEKGMTNVTAEYSFRDNGLINVLNSGDKNGKRKKAVGRARRPDETQPASLQVSFFGPFWADYIILEIEKDNYSWVLVGSGNRFFWILSRTPELDDTIIQKLLEKARSLGYETSSVILAKQRPGWEVKQSD